LIPKTKFDIDRPITDAINKKAKYLKLYLFRLLLQILNLLWIIFLLYNYFKFF